MKKLLLLLLTTNIINVLAGQNILLLKSGEKINGKIEKFKNDTLTFSFKGVKMQFKSSEIVAIYFDESKIPKENANTTSTIIQQKQDGKIAGVVTYYFNDNYGDKPDIGAKILIIDVTQAPDFNYQTVDSFHYAKTYKILNDRYAATGKSKIPEDIKEKVRAYRVNSEEEFKDFDKRTSNELNKIKFTNIIYCKKLVVDGNGTFSIDVPAGKYYVYATSNNRQGHGMTEIMGKVYCKEIIVKSGETSNFSANFDLY